jgi:hypothetical protein
VKEENASSLKDPHFHHNQEERQIPLEVASNNAPSVDIDSVASTHARTKMEEFADDIQSVDEPSQMLYSDDMISLGDDSQMAAPRSYDHSSVESFQSSSSNSHLPDFFRAAKINVKKGGGEKAPTTTDVESVYEARSQMSSIVEVDSLVEEPCKSILEPASSVVVLQQDTIPEELSQQDSTNTEQQMEPTVPATSKPASNKIPEHSYSRRRPKTTDLQSFLERLAVLSEIQQPMDTALLNTTKCHQMKNVKWTLMNHCFSRSSKEELEIVALQRFIQDYGLESDDLDSIVEHIQLCQSESQEIRWDLIETMFFPEPESSSRHHPKELESSDLRSLDSEITSSDIESLAEENVYDESSIAETGTRGPSVLLTRRESYQQAILDLVYEPLEAKLDQLQPVEVKMRQQVLIQLLQATSEEEAHLTELSLDDVAEVVHHAKDCKEIDASLHWSMIRAMVMGEMII